jgi:ABC-type Zn uptake system ZnuABC Zn-binding protein ZnuA
MNQQTGLVTAKRRNLSGRGAARRIPSFVLSGTVASLTTLGLVVTSFERGATSVSTVIPQGEPITTAGGDESTPAITTPVLSAGVSIPPLADLVQRIGGDRVEVVSVVPQGVDGHTYEPSPTDVAGLAGADIMFLASEDLNPSVTRIVAANLPPGAVTIDLMSLTVSENEAIADRTHSHGADGSHSHANVHVWTDPTIAMRWVMAIRDQLIARDPAGSQQYAANAEVLSGQLQALHQAIIEATATVPEAFRTLVVYHDSWSYFGRTYGYKVVGALQAADFAEPSAAEMSKMIEQVRSAGVPVFFGAAVFPTEVLQRVSDESGVPYVADLSDDELPGVPGEVRHSYVGMMIDNVRNIVSSLGGDTASLDSLSL